MSVIYKVITRPTDPRVPNSPKRFYPHLITLGQSVSLKYLAEKMRDRSSLSVGDIKSVIQNFVDKMKEQLLEGKSVNIEGLGVFMLAARSKGADLAKDITAKSVESVRIFFQANKELRITKSATREDEKLDLISLDEYLKKNSVVVSPEDPENPGEGGGEGCIQGVYGVDGADDSRRGAKFCLFGGMYFVERVSSICCEFQFHDGKRHFV